MLQNLNHPPRTTVSLMVTNPLVLFQNGKTVILLLITAIFLPPPESTRTWLPALLTVTDRNRDRVMRVDRRMVMRVSVILSIH